MITVTENAVKQLHELLDAESPGERRGLRIFIETGGCAGLQYGMRIDGPEEGDVVVEQGGVRLLLDAYSAQHLKGATVDFVDGLSGSGFKIHNPNAVRSCGCGTSFEPAAGHP